MALRHGSDTAKLFFGAPTTPTTSANTVAKASDPRPHQSAIFTTMDFIESATLWDCLKGAGAPTGPALFETRAQLYAPRKSSSYFRPHSPNTHCRALSVGGGEPWPGDDEVIDSDCDDDRHSARSGHVSPTADALFGVIFDDDDAVDVTTGITANTHGHAAVGAISLAPATSSPSGGPVQRMLSSIVAQHSPQELDTPVGTGWGGADDGELFEGFGSTSDDDDDDDEDEHDRDHDDIDDGEDPFDERVCMTYTRDWRSVADLRDATTPQPRAFPSTARPACTRRRRSIAIVADRWGLSISDAADIMAAVDAANKATPGWK